MSLAQFVELESRLRGVERFADQGKMSAYRGFGLFEAFQVTGILCRVVAADEDVLPFLHLGFERSIGTADCHQCIDALTCLEQGFARCVGEAAQLRHPGQADSSENCTGETAEEDESSAD